MTGDGRSTVPLVARRGGQATPRGAAGRDRRRTRAARRATLAGATVLGAVVLFSWAWPGLEGRAARPWELVNFLAFIVRAFAFHIGIAALAFIAAAAMLRQWRLALTVLAPIAAFCALPEALWIVRPAWSGEAHAPEARRPDIIILSFNTHQGRLRTADLRAASLAHDADIVVAQEASATLFPQLREALMDAYPHAAHLGQDWLYGHAIFSRHPFAGDQRCMAFADPPPKPHPNRMRDGDMQQRIVVDVGGRPLIVQNLHMISPMNPTLVAEQARQFTGLIASLREDGMLGDHAPPLLMIGDFNATPRSEPHARLRSLGLREVHAAAGAGRGATWPANRSLIPRGLGVRLDNAFVNAALTPRFSRVLGGMGSDHRAILIGVDFAAASASPQPAPRDQPTSEEEHQPDAGAPP